MGLHTPIFAIALNQLRLRNSMLDNNFCPLYNQFVKKERFQKAPSIVC